jgi:hypothetical protein
VPGSFKLLSGGPADEGLYLELKKTDGTTFEYSSVSANAAGGSVFMLDNLGQFYSVFNGETVYAYQGSGAAVGELTYATMSDITNSNGVLLTCVIAPVTNLFTCQVQGNTVLQDNDSILIIGSRLFYTAITLQAKHCSLA